MKIKKIIKFSTISIFCLAFIIACTQPSATKKSLKMSAAATVQPLATGTTIAAPNTALPSIVPDSTGQAAAQAALLDMYNKWKAYYVTSAGCPAGGLRVQRLSEPGDTGDTVSEGIGYGMLLAAYMNDQTVFDGLWAYAKSHFDANSLMNWKINSDGSTPSDGTGPATDADQDMALALIVADKEWGGYTTDATTLINNVYNHEVQQSGTYQYYLLPGDSWGNNVGNPSYLSPAWYRVFAEYTGNTNWNNVADASYTLMNAVLVNSPGAHLVPDWCDWTGGLHPAAVGSYTGWDQYSWNACRTPWRFSIDVLWYNNVQAQTYCNNWISFFNTTTGGNASVLDAGYDLEGTAQVTYQNAAFTGAVACAADASTTVSDAFKSSLYSAAILPPIGSGTWQGYFGDTLEVLYMLAFIGDFYNPMHDTTPPPTVLMTGNDNVMGACYWTATGTANSKTLLGFSGWGYSIFNYNGTPYISGTATDSTNGKLGAYYYNSGTLTTFYGLPTGGPWYQSDCHSIFVDNGTVYTCGVDDAGNACYWTGTNKTILASSGVNGQMAQSIYAANGTVYTCGFDSSGNSCYWTGTAETVLSTNTGSNPNFFMSAYSIKVNNGAVYTCGTDNNGNACYWTGTTETPLTSGGGLTCNTYPRAYSIFVDTDGTVYTAGSDTDGNACYWKNSTETVLSGNVSYVGTAYSIYVYNGTVYTCGVDGTDHGCYWTGTAETALNDQGTPYAITVIP